MYYFVVKPAQQDNRTSPFADTHASLLLGRTRCCCGISLFQEQKCGSLLLVARAGGGVPWSQPFILRREWAGKERSPNGRCLCTISETTPPRNMMEERKGRRIHMSCTPQKYVWKPTHYCDGGMRSRLRITIANGKQRPGFQARRMSGFWT